MNIRFLYDGLRRHLYWLYRWCLHMTIPKPSRVTHESQTRVHNRKSAQHHQPSSQLVPLLLSAISSICLCLISSTSNSLTLFLACCWALSSGTSGKKVCLHRERVNNDKIILVCALCIRDIIEETLMSLYMYIISIKFTLDRYNNTICYWHAHFLFYTLFYCFPSTTINTQNF